MKHQLLPHKYQKPAFIIFIVCLFWVWSSILVDGLSSPFAGFVKGDFFQVVTILILYVSLLMFIFSQEKIEDELITSYRLHSAAFAFLVGFGIIAVLNVIQAILPDEQYFALREWRMNCFWNGNAVMYLLLLYFISFKIKVKKLERRMRDEE